MQEYSTKQLLKAIETIRESSTNCMQCTLDSYAEIISKLDLLTFIITENEKK